MTARNRRVRVAFWVMGVCVLAAVALASPSGLPGQDVLGTSRAALALPWGGETIIDPGDPLISDDHVAFMDRGVYAYQDMVCGAGCDLGGKRGGLFLGQIHFPISGQQTLCLHEGFSRKIKLLEVEVGMIAP